MPVDRGIIEQQLQALGEGAAWWERRELRDLPLALNTEEQILAIAVGELGRPRLLRRSWLFLVTDRRLLCLQSRGRMQRKQLEVAGNHITRAALGVGPFSGKLMIVAGVNRYKLLMKRADAYKLLHALSRIVPARETPLDGMSTGRMIGRVFQHVLDLPAVALAPGIPAPPPAPAFDGRAYDQRLQALESQVQQLQEQVDFLERLLEQRSIDLPR